MCKVGGCAVRSLGRVGELIIEELQVHALNVFGGHVFCPGHTCLGRPDTSRQPCLGRTRPDTCVCAAPLAPPPARREPPPPALTQLEVPALVVRLVLSGVAELVVNDVLGPVRLDVGLLIDWGPLEPREEKRRGSQLPVSRRDLLLLPSFDDDRKAGARR